jgi:salicylate hydroxylase
LWLARPEDFDIMNTEHALGATDGAASENDPIRIGIIGAGPAGLMAALALEHYVARGRISITILDKNATAADYPGVEYGIQERACRALERIGLLEPALQRGNPCSEISFFNARLGKRFRSVKSDPKYTRCVVRQEFLADLEALLRHTIVERLHVVSHAMPSGDGTVTVEGQVSPADAPFSQQFDLLIAADGVHSIVRKSLFPEAAEIQDRGFSCIYMLVEDDGGTASPAFRALANGGRSALAMGHRSTMTMFPLGKNRLALGIGFDHQSKTSLWAQHGLESDTSWQDIAAETKKAIAAVLVADTDDGDGTLIQALDLIPDWNSYKIYLWAMRDTDPLRQPYTKTGNVIVIGDAAHAIMPTIGMGASLAIEDAEQLAASVAEAISLSESSDDFRRLLLDKVFLPFTSARQPVWQELINRARLAAEQNFIDVSKRKRFSMGSQIPNNHSSRIVSALERVADKLRI